MATKKKTKVVETTISTIITSKIAELELLECSCTTSQNELGEEELVKCDRCKQIEYWKTHCVCGVCRECINLLLEHYQSLPCECTYKTIKVEETVINPDTGLEETVMVDKQVVDVQCGRCKKIDELEKTLERYNILEKAYIDEKIWHLCKVDLRNNEITVPNNDVAKPSDIEILKDENTIQDEFITTTMLATAEVNEQLANTDTMTTISLEALAELNEQLILLQEEVKALKGGI